MAFLLLFQNTGFRSWIKTYFIYRILINCWDYCYLTILLLYSGSLKVTLLL